MTWESVREVARALSLEDRLRLMESLWDEISTEPALADLSPEFQAELDRRIEQAEKSPETGRSWRDVVSELKTS